MKTISEALKKVLHDCVASNHVKNGVKGEFNSIVGHYMVSTGYMLTPWGQIYTPGQPMIMAEEFTFYLLDGPADIWWFSSEVAGMAHALSMIDRYKFLELQKQIMSLGSATKVSSKLYELLVFWAENHEGVDGILPFAVTQDQLAMVLSTGRVTITRAFGELKERQAVSMAGQYIQVH